MILDKSKVSKFNQGLGYDFAESLRVGGHEILGFQGGVIELGEKPTVFKSAGFIGGSSSSEPKPTETKEMPKPIEPQEKTKPKPTESKSKPVESKPLEPKVDQSKKTIKVPKTVEKTKYECTFCGKSGHLVRFCFRKAKKERRERLRTLRVIRGKDVKVPERFECACHCRFSGVSRFLRRDVHPRRDLAGMGQNRRDQHVHKYFVNSNNAFSTRVNQYWIPKSFLTNPSTDSSRSFAPVF